MDLRKEDPIVLIVEDDGLVREDIASEFRRCGWTVLESSTGEGAIGLLESGEAIDALVTDIQLAGQASGWEVADAFRSLHPDFPVVYTSGNADQRERRVPGSTFVSKPCMATVLVAACSELEQTPPRRASLSRF